jgi:hypothetical protein
VRCTSYIAIISVLQLAGCASIRQLTPEADAVVNCVIEEVTASGKEVSVNIDIFQPNVGPLINRTGPKIDAPGRGAWLTIFTSVEFSDGKFAFHGLADDTLFQAVVSGCDVTPIILIHDIVVRIQT